MAAKRIDPKIAENIIIDWRLGQLSQRQIAEKRKVSNGLVAKLTKGVERDVKNIVSAGIQYNNSLQQYDERIIAAVTDVVDEAVKRKRWLDVAALRNLAEAMEMPCENQNDCRLRADTILKAKETVFGKTPDTAIQINNRQADERPRTLADFYAKDLSDEQLISIIQSSD